MPGSNIQDMKRLARQSKPPPCTCGADDPNSERSYHQVWCRYSQWVILRERLAVRQQDDFWSSALQLGGVDDLPVALEGEHDARS